MARMDVHDERLMAIPQGLVAIGAAAAEFEALAASSGIRRGVTRKAGPQTSTAAMTLPRAS